MAASDTPFFSPERFRVVGYDRTAGFGPKRNLFWRQSETRDFARVFISNAASPMEKAVSRSNRPLAQWRNDWRVE